jgi:hypothetical protein
LCLGKINIKVHHYKSTAAKNAVGKYWVFRAQADWTFILPSELPTKELRLLPIEMPPLAYQTSQYVTPRGGIFLGKWRSSFAGSSDGKMKSNQPPL